MPRRRPPRSAPHAVRRALPYALAATCALLLAVDGGWASGVGRHALTRDPASDRTVPSTPRRAPHRTPIRHGSPADSATVRRVADLVRHARDAERAAQAHAPPSLATAPGAPDPALADSARRAYLAAAALLPDAADWLRLRAAALTTNATERARILGAVRLPAARDRIPIADALATARAGDPLGAAATLDRAGRPAQALALRLQAASDPAARAAVRAALVKLLRPIADPTLDTRPDVRPGAAELPRDRARSAATLLDSAFSRDSTTPLSTEERLRVARTLALARDAATLRRAAAEFASARASLPDGLAGDDAFQYAGVLARTGQWREAAAAYARVQTPAAAYERAHALLRAGDAAGARAALRTLADAPAASDTAATTAAAGARFLLAELTADDGAVADARAEYRRVAREYPATRWGPLARVRAGLIALVTGDPRGAAADLDAVARPAAAPLASATPDSAIADSAANGTVDASGVAAAYWAGRAWAAAGDTAQAWARWELTLARDPASYYAWRAAARLGRPWNPITGGAGGVPVDGDVEAAGRRAGLLERVGLTVEAGYERDYVIRAAGDAPDRLLAAAHAFAAGPRPGVGIRLAARAVERGAPRTAAVWHLLDPLLYGDAVRRAANAAGVDPALGAGLIRQESNFTADAVSPVGARGLMQLMPDVGRSLWRGEGGASAWSPDLLYVPDVNLALGMRHLAAGLRGYPDPAYALAAYNAGGARVARWRRQPGAADPELFVEGIPFAETRDYVRVVLRNRELYRALYRL